MGIIKSLYKIVQHFLINITGTNQVYEMLRENNRRIKELNYHLTNIDNRYIREALGRIEKRQLSEVEFDDVHDKEFKVYSQWGEDGIIQYLLKNVNIENKIFIEFGVEDYKESNTRFLLVNDNWSGLIIDSCKENIIAIKNDPIYWQYNLKAVEGFVTRDNINHLIQSNGVYGDIGLLSIDIDGNDYWIWEVIDCVSAAIVIVEYNSRFGHQDAVSVPYDEKYLRSEAHYSMIYYGASLNAFCMLARKKGYVFVGCNAAGNNAFFVRSSLKSKGIRELLPEDGFVEAKFRESRDPAGKLSYLSRDEEIELLSELPLIKFN